MNATRLPSDHHGFRLAPLVRAARTSIGEALVALLLIGLWCAAYCVLCPADPVRAPHVVVATR